MSRCIYVKFFFPQLSNWKISIRRLMLGADGGILDEEDRVADVIEDKDQVN